MARARPEQQLTRKFFFLSGVFFFFFKGRKASSEGYGVMWVSGEGHINTLVIFSFECGSGLGQQFDS